VGNLRVERSSYRLIRSASSPAESLPVHGPCPRASPAGPAGLAAMPASRTDEVPTPHGFPCTRLQTGVPRRRQTVHRGRRRARSPALPGSPGFGPGATPSVTSSSPSGERRARSPAVSRPSGFQPEPRKPTRFTLQAGPGTDSHRCTQAGLISSPGCRSQRRAEDTIPRPVKARHP